MEGGRFMGLELAVSRDGLCVLANRQLSLFNCAELVDPYMERVLGKLEYCFLRITNKYYRGCSGGVFFPIPERAVCPVPLCSFKACISGWEQGAGGKKLLSE